MYCGNCGKWFVLKPPKPRQKYCSPECRKGIRASKKYSSRYGVQVQDHFVLRRTEKNVGSFKKEIEDRMA